MDFDELGINEVVDLLDNTNMEAVLRDFGDRNQKEDPVMHFFEGFLQEYDSEIRKDRGVFYTPQPVVSFIVRSVDEQLRTEFGLEDGLADTTTWGELVARITDLKIPEGTSPDQAFVQILDPATGTGTFPVEVIDLIYKTMTAKWQSQGNREAQIKELWNQYVPEHLLPRLHGYELMMAPYAIAHMKMGLKLYETGYRFKSKERARIYLTNALESARDFSGTFSFAVPALAKEAEAVNSIKRNQRFTVVIGNPPYSYVSSNIGSWITGLVRDYYKVDGQPLGERNPKGLLDDYVKFIRFAHYQIQQSQHGIVGFICNNGFIDNPTFRGMRHSLVATFNEIRILDLHGSTKKKEIDASGKADKNVFDIQQGVAISILTKKLTSDNFKTKVHQYDCVGAREKKYRLLQVDKLGFINWEYAQAESPEFMFFPRDSGLQKEFEQFISITGAFQSSIAGFTTHRDDFALAFDKATMQERITSMRSPDLTDAELKISFNLTDTSDWKLSKARARLQTEVEPNVYSSLALYRPFDFRYCYLDEAIMDRPRPGNKLHVLGKENLLLCVGRQGLAVNDETWSLLFCSKLPVDQNLYRRGGVTVFPLLQYANSNDLLYNSEQANSNLNTTIQKACNLAFGNQNDDLNQSSKAFFYYTYALLFSKSYRVRYADFLKSDFPRIPIPKKSKVANQCVNLGRRLVNMHLMEDGSLGRQITAFIDSGSREVEKISYADNTVWINNAKTCGFKGVPEAVWKFHIGGYQVCDKWLKDRKVKSGKNPQPGRILSDADVEHYQKIITVISETIRIMAEIDEVIGAHGGWPDAFLDDNNE
ncbi:MAG: type ISP restriction/modification enzyme [Burkholderiales bacterium]